MTRSGWRAAAASAAVFAALTVAMGHQALPVLGTAFISDLGDPVLTASILEWNARHLPLSDRWWQFPSFHPVRDTTAFTEHLLGLSVIATPLFWLTGSPIATYNLTFLLTFPLSALAMYALAWRLTGRAPAAFLAGLAFGFAPYRISHLAHIHVLALFWAPLALLGLHAWLETGRRRWLVLFGAAWALQGLANAYMLVLLSLLVGAWMVWFLVLRRRWRGLAQVSVALGVASLPLLPVVVRYLSVHAQHGFSRSFGEVAYYGTDVAGLLCASTRLTFWGWLRTGCRPEGELFAGLGVLLVCVAGAIAWRRRSGHLAPSRPAVAAAPGGEPASPVEPAAFRVARRLLLAAAAVYAAIVTSVVLLGPWEVAIGPLRASASSAVKPFSTLVLLLVAAGLLLPAVRCAARRGSVATFYAATAGLGWVLAWGPAPKFLGEEILYMAPYRWIMVLPGVDGLRVPARVWMLVLVCLGVLVALAAAAWLRDRAPRIAVPAVAVMSLLLVLDGWAVFPMAGAPAEAPDPAALRGRIVMELPLGEIVSDVSAQYRAVAGGWTTVNGYSGHEPAHYPALRAAARSGEGEVLFGTFLARGSLDVLAPADDLRWRALVERQPGARVVDRNDSFVHYRMPQQGTPAVLPRVSGERLPIASVTGTCEGEWLRYAIDGNPASAWHCGDQLDDHEVTIDIGHVARLSAVVHGLGPFKENFPRGLQIDTSDDGETWRAAWRGSVTAVVIAAAMDDPRALRPVFAFEPRQARYVRLRQVGPDSLPWSIRDLEIWSSVE